MTSHFWLAPAASTFWRSLKRRINISLIYEFSFSISGAFKCVERFFTWNFKKRMLWASSVRFCFTQIKIFLSDQIILIMKIKSLMQSLRRIYSSLCSCLLTKLGYWTTIWKCPYSKPSVTGERQLHFWLSQYQWVAFITY